MLLSLDKETHYTLMNWAQVAQEMRIMALKQRRNKYSWGKADVDTQYEEIKELQNIDTELAAVPASVLKFAVWQLEQEYQAFFKALTAFKKDRSNPQPSPPEFGEGPHALLLHPKETNDFLPSILADTAHTPETYLLVRFLNETDWDARTVEVAL